MEAIKSNKITKNGQIMKDILKKNLFIIIKKYRINVINLGFENAEKIIFVVVRKFIEQKNFLIWLRNGNKIWYCWKHN